MKRAHTPRQRRMLPVVRYTTTLCLHYSSISRLVDHCPVDWYHSLFEHTPLGQPKTVNVSIATAF